MASIQTQPTSAIAALWTALHFAKTVISGKKLQTKNRQSKTPQACAPAGFYVFT
jgi:hypothetical protein